jgi:hypothetical protein
MPTYTVYFRSPSSIATEAIKARTPKQALQLACKRADDDALTLDWDRYELSTDVEEIEVADERDNSVACWQSEDLALRLAAADLLDALKDLVARDRAEALESGFTDDEMTWLEDSRRAIRKAKGDAS